MKKLFFILLLLLSGIVPFNICCANDVNGGGQRVGDNLIPLHVEGRYFKDPAGNVVNLHGFAQTYSSYFNEEGKRWNNYDVEGCLNYNKDMIDKIIEAGWKVNFMRLHMDPYWSSDPQIYHNAGDESDIRAFSMERFKKYLAEVFIPMAQYAQAKGLYVVMRPPGVCPQKIQLNDDYHKYLLKIWDYVSQQPELKDNPAVMFELANEPVGFTTSQGKSEAEEMTMYMQAIVDKIRTHCNNILLIPGLGWQSRYDTFAQYPIVGDNIGFAVHCYPGWYNGGTSETGDVKVDYRSFRAGWREKIGPVSANYPIMVTETDWSPSKYGKMTFAQSTTGTVGSDGFGANFKKIVDDDGNVSWLIFAWEHYMAQFDKDNPATATDSTFFNDPEACLWPCYHWFEDYAKEFYPSETKYEQALVNPYEKTSSNLFPLTNDDVNPNIYSKGTFDETTGTLITGQYGFGGWQYPAIDLSDYKYLVIELNRPQTVGASFRLFDSSDYFGACSMTEIGNQTRVVIDLHNQTKYKEANGVKTSYGALNLSHIYKAGFWTYGGGDGVSIRSIFLSNDGVNDATTGINNIENKREMNSSNFVYNLQGQVVARDANALNNLPRGIYIVNGKKVKR